MNHIFTAHYRLVLLVSAIITLFYNRPFFHKLTQAFPLEKGYTAVVAAAGRVLFLATALVFSLLAGSRTTKPFLIIAIISAAAGNYFMTAYGVVIDTTMWQNMLQTDAQEAAGLMNLSFAFQFVLLGLVPAMLIARWKLPIISFKREVLSKAITVVSILILAGSTLFAFSANFSSFFREYKPIRYYANPLYSFYSGIKLAMDSSQESRPETISEVSMDAKMGHMEHRAELDERPERELVVLVIGESARADHFQLNGYGRETNPELSKLDNLVSFTNFTSCGTTTAVSVPCMFTLSDRHEFNDEDIYTYENALDVLKRRNVNILWRDNNSSSKGVADRVEYQNFRDPALNPTCKDECLDDGLLLGLQDYVDAHKTGDILIILHQIGSHGPEYFKRYPKDSEHFTPVCKTSKLGDCGSDEITNADHFLAQVVRFIQKNDMHFEAGMVYLSDHGESLGENGIYLHGMPFAIAPKAQKHVAAIVWGGTYFDYSIDALKANRDQPYTQDAVYCMLLSLFEVETKSCPSDKRILLTPSKIELEQQAIERAQEEAVKPAAGAKSPEAPAAAHPAE